MLNNEWIDLAYRIIQDAAEDVKKENPASIEYVSALKFFDSKWFENLADGCDMNVKNVKRKINGLRLKRAKQWMEELEGGEKTETETKIYRTMRDNHIEKEKALLCAWENQESWHETAGYGTKWQALANEKEV